MLQAECAGTHLFSDKSTIPQCLLFLFFKKRKRPPSFLFRRKEAKENHLRLSFFSALLLLSPTCNTKRTVHIRTVRFFVPSRTCGKASFLRLIIYPAVSFVSFLQEKKTFPFKKKKTSSCGPKTKPPPSVRRGQRRGASSGDMGGRLIYDRFPIPQEWKKYCPCTHPICFSVYWILYQSPELPRI